MFYFMAKSNRIYPKDYKYSKQKIDTEDEDDKFLFRVGFGHFFIVVLILCLL